MEKDFYSNGKLLLTGEYVVLDGAWSLAIPTQYGQSLTVRPIETPLIRWEAYNHEQKRWFLGEFHQIEGKITTANVSPTALTLAKILTEAKRQNPSFLTDSRGYHITTHLNFPNNWGLGSSSTLINNIAQWVEADPYRLLEKSFGGSGYDIAAAQNDHPILYRTAQDIVEVKPVEIHWDFTDSLFFIHLNKKQNSREGIARYRSKKVNTDVLSQISNISQAVPKAQTLEALSELMTAHEKLISDTITLPTLKETLFSDFPGFIKSLGAWGGDFILASGQDDAKTYFKQRGYTTIIPFDVMKKRS